MSRFRELEPDFDWKRVEVGLEDIGSQDRQCLLSMLQEIHLIRAFETTVLELKRRKLVHGPVHSSVGQEAVAVGAMSAIRRTDLVAGTHRAHHQFLAKAVRFYAPEDYDPLRDALSPETQEAVKRLLAEIMGLAPGCCGGRGGSMHLHDADIGLLGTSAIVAGGIPLATGAAWAQKYEKRDTLVACFFSDGAMNQGAFHEALNLAGLWKLPIVYVVENNQYAVGTSVAESVPIRHLSLRAASYGMKGRIVDGMDPVAVKAAVEEAADDLRRGGAPYLIEAMTYRFFHHAGDIPGSKYGYRDRGEEDTWRSLDPAKTFPAKLMECGYLSEDENEHLQRAAQGVVDRAVDFCTEGERNSRSWQVSASLWPEPRSLTEGLRSDGRELDGVAFVEAEDLPLERTVQYVEAIAGVTGRWLEQDPRVFVLGEEVANFGGGAYQATKGLPERYPGRIINTPISEAGFSGLACGAAICGLKPVVEIMFPDFALVAADQIFNHIGKLRHIYGGRIRMPLVIRTRVAIGCGYGGQHSMDPVSLFAMFPGWRIVAPTTPFDYIGLFNSAMLSEDPVLVVEHHELYNKTGRIPSDGYDHYVAMGKAKKLTEGADVTVLAYSSAVALATEAAAELAKEGIGVEAIDLRTLDFASMDYGTIGESVRKTGRLVIVEQAPRSGSIGATIAWECERRLPGCLKCPPARVAGADVPNPVSRVLELAALPSVETTTEAIRRAVRGEA